MSIDPAPTSAPVSAGRHAVYLIPSGPWSSLGQRWLGRDAGTGERIPRIRVEDDPAIEAWTEAPRLYGLHATLKPPFQLAEGASFSDLDEALRRLAGAMSDFGIPLQLKSLRGFLAWCVAATESSTAPDGFPVAAAMPAALEQLASACVADLDRFRAPPSSEETARRMRAELTPPQSRNLHRWGYPYVFDTFVFHVTLTERLGTAALAAAQSALTRCARPDEMLALQPGAVMPVRDIGLFVQAAPGLPFVIARRYGFDGRVREGMTEWAV